MSRKVFIKVHGTTYETLNTTLQRYPFTRLGSESKRMDFQEAENTGILTVDCKSSAFDAILFYYQSFGILRRPNDVPMDDFVQECRSLEIEENDIKKMQEQEGFLYEKTNIGFENVRCKLLYDLWRFLEVPESSVLASLFAVFSCAMIAILTCLTCIQTLPSTKETRMLAFYKNPLLLFELGLNLFFGVEFTLRLIASPKKLEFIKSVSNIVDFLAVFPYFIALIIDVENIGSVQFLRVVRTVRILRLIRLTKHSKTLDIAVRIMGNCLGDLLTMVSIIFISCFVCGAFEYNAEMNVPGTKFTSIPASIWWAAQTVIPVGYGDIVPQSMTGKVVGGIVVVLSALTFTLPLLFLGGKFLKFYAKNFGVTIMSDFRPRQKSSKK